MKYSTANAFYQNIEECMKLLLSHGAEVNITDKYVSNDNNINLKYG